MASRKRSAATPSKRQAMEVEEEEGAPEDAALSSSGDEMDAVQDDESVGSRSEDSGDEESPRLAPGRTRNGGAQAGGKGSAQTDAGAGKDSGSENGVEQDEDADQIRVVFVTPHERFKVTETSITVPARLSRAGLSQIINHLLQLDPIVPFDFLILEKEALVRKSLSKHVQELGLSTETAVKLEFSPAVQPPDLSAEDEWPDWIAAVDASVATGNSGAAVVACGAYDGSLQLSMLALDGSTGEHKFELLEKLDVHSAPVKAVQQFGSSYVVSGSKDGKVRLFETVFTENNKGAKPTVAYSEVAECAAHTGSVEAVIGTRRGDEAVLASAGWDRVVCVWKVKLDSSKAASSADEDASRRSAKSRRTGPGNGHVGARASREIVTEPAAFFTDHTDNVSSLCWEDAPEPATVFSGSWDRTIRVWDVTREAMILSLETGKVVTALAHNGSRSLIASGHSDHIVRLWDSRTAGDSACKLQLRGHKGWVSGVAWHPTQSHLLASCSHDKTVRIWDARASVPLHTLSKHTAKVLSVAWTSDGATIVSGGADAKLRAFALRL